jgi:alkyldihydroxyacetonephosphate synthase
MKRDTLIKELYKILDRENVLDDKSNRRQKAIDLYALRLYQKHVGWEPVIPSVVVQPCNVDEISRILKLCNENNIPIIPYGGGSGVLAGAETIREETLVIDLTKLNRILNLNEENLSITCEAGVFIKDLEAYVNEKGYILGHYPQSMDLAQMGGLAATRSIGQFSTKYGGIEELLIGVEAVLANGDIVYIKPNPRRSVGPDLKHLLIGSEGFIGIITKIIIKVFPKPEFRWMHAYRTKTMRQGLEIIRRVMRKGVKPPVIRLHDWLECEKPYGAFMEEEECLLIFLSEGTNELCEYEEKIIDEVVKDNGGVSAGEKPVEIWLKHRNDAVDEYEEYGAKGFLVDTIEISGGWDNIANIYEDTIDRVYYEVPEIMYFSGHSSHSYLNGTNLYFEMGAILPNAKQEEAKRVHSQTWDIIMEVALKYGGSIGHHHGVGKHRTKYIKDELGSSYKLMEGIKKAFDPKGIMNPGVIIKDMKG